MQTTSRVLMVRPCRFGFNPDTAASNAYQQAVLEPAAAQAAALAEFDAYVGLLRQHGVTVDVFDDTAEPHTPDSIFPNNWFSTHTDGSLYLYPMEGVNRRLERRVDIVAWLRGTFDVRRLVDLSPAERHGRYLEGTGSMVLDRTHRRIYAALSSRTHHEELRQFASRIGYQVTAFTATDAAGRPIYHTNVLMCVGPTWAVVCLEAVADAEERHALQQQLAADGKEVIALSREQVVALAGNMLALHNAAGEPLLVLSQRAHAALTPTQCQQLAAHGRLVTPAIPVIETLGGGGVRCMLAELFLPEHPVAPASFTRRY
ncbi:citrulline utilization hydrolase CtlX [Vogesella oryzae]|uniref:citrulline utilization hydrolase CtlX n=1 Tax=Vogesella oryzae TaxID=1735285 RepID=UPI0015816F51|nr:arginine deiminase-related protein [Vogesella oryzae]